MSTYVVGMTGASGSILALKLVEQLLDKGHTVHLTASRAARLVIAQELPDMKGKGFLPGLVHERLIEWPDRDFYAPFASGSADIAGMTVVPCSMSTLGAVAAGISDNVLRRGAEVMLKEKRRLVLVPRETPMSEIQLQNMLTVSRAGGVILPPVLTFYQDPGPDVSEQVDFIVSRILDHLGVPNQLYKRWGEDESA